MFWTDKNKKVTEITDLCNELCWKEDNEGHTMELSFKVSDTDERYIPHHSIEAGDKIQLIYIQMPENEKKAEYCFEVTEADREEPTRRVTAKDFCMFFEKNDITVQLTNTDVKNAVSQVVNKLGAEVYFDNVNMGASVNKVYIDNAESVLEDLLAIQENADGYKYWYEMNGSRLRVYRLGEETEYYRHKPAENVAEYDTTIEHSSVSYKHSIENMKNSVKAIVKSKIEGNMPALEVTVTDEDSVKRYGKFEMKKEIAADEAYEIEALAKSELKKVGSIKREIQCEMAGAINARINRVMHIKDEYTGIDALMRISQCTHTYKNGIYTMALGLMYLKEYVSENTQVSRVEREDIDVAGKSATFYDGENQDIRVQNIISIAEKYMGVPYVYGGSTPSGFDCSGFVCYVLREAGMPIARTSAQGLYDMTKRVKSPKAGDLIFWINTNPSSDNFITHVGICIGNGKNIQAGGSKVHVASNGGAYAYGRLSKE